MKSSETVKSMVQNPGVQEESWNFPIFQLQTLSYLRNTDNIISLRRGPHAEGLRESSLNYSPISCSSSTPSLQGLDYDCGAGGTKKKSRISCILSTCIIQYNTKSDALYLNTALIKSTAVGTHFSLEEVFQQHQRRIKTGGLLLSSLYI